MKVFDFIVLKSDSYIKSAKQLKRFRNFENDIKDFLLSINDIGDLGIPLGNDFYKVRIATSDKNKGKSYGYRLITLLKVVDTKIYLVYVYDKSALENISEEEIDRLIIGL